MSRIFTVWSPRSDSILLLGVIVSNFCSEVSEYDETFICLTDDLVELCLNYLCCSGSIKCRIGFYRSKMCFWRSVPFLFLHWVWFLFYKVIRVFTVPATLIVYSWISVNNLHLHNKVLTFSLYFYYFFTNSFLELSFCCGYYLLVYLRNLHFVHLLSSGHYLGVHVSVCQKLVVRFILVTAFLSEKFT